MPDPTFQLPPSSRNIRHPYHVGDILGLPVRLLNAPDALSCQFTLFVPIDVVNLTASLDPMLGLSIPTAVLPPGTVVMANEQAPGQLVIVVAAVTPFGKPNQPLCVVKLRAKVIGSGMVGIQDGGFVDETRITTGTGFVARCGMEVE